MEALYYYGQIIETGFDAEGQITSAIDQVTRDVTRTIYMLSGHGEAELNATVTAAIAKQNLKLSSVNLLRDGAVPEDCDLILIYSPQLDLADEELTMLLGYIAQGGNVMVLSDNVVLDNMNSLMAAYGLTFVDGYIADPSRCYQNSPFSIFPMLATGHNIIESLPSGGNVLALNSRGIKTLDDRKSGLTVQYFMYTSDTAFAVTENDDMIEDRYLLAATSTESTENGGGRLTMIACPYLIDETLLTSFSNILNLNVFMNAITDNFEETSSIAIPTKSLEVPYNTIPSASKIGLICTVVIPLVLLAFGFVFWLKRRKL